MEDVVAFDGVEVDIRGRRVLGPLTLSIRDDERWAILGPNGSGKTTLLRLAGAMRQPSVGVVRILGQRVGRTDLRALRERIAHVGHAIADLVPSHLDVADVVLSGKRGAAVPWMLEVDDADRARASELLERFGCGHLRGQSLAACSQGERQRVLLARALFGRPELVLLDEPAAGLDLPGREGLVRALERDDELGRLPTILVTHHVEEVPASVTHAALLRGGLVVASGPVAPVLTDANAEECFGMPLSVARVRGRWTIAP